MPTGNVNIIYPTLIIGVAETGFECLKLIADKFGRIPETIKLIHIEIRDEAKTHNTQKFNNISSCRLIFDHDAITGTADECEGVHKWFSQSEQKVDPASVKGTRIMGRLALFASIVDLKNKINEALSAFAKFPAFDKDNVPLNVFIILPFDCVTCTAIAIDLAYIIRQAVYEKTVERVCEISGYFMLPDAFCDSGRQALESAKINTVAALKELDMFMEKSAQFSASYPDGSSISSNIGSQKPYDFAYLISAVNIINREVMKHVVVEKIFHIAGSKLTTKSNKLLAAVPVNAFKTVTEGEFIGKKISYSSFGVSSCVIPSDKLVNAYFKRFAASLLPVILAAPYCKEEEAIRIIENDTTSYLSKFGISTGGCGQIFEMIYEQEKAGSECSVDFDEMNFDSSGKLAVNRTRLPEKVYHDICVDMKARSEVIKKDAISELNAIISRSIADAGQRAFSFCIKFCDALINIIAPLAEKTAKDIQTLDGARNVLIEKAGTSDKKIRISYYLPWFVRNKSAILSLSKEYLETTNEIFVNRFKRDRLEAGYSILSTLKAETEKISKSVSNILKALKNINELCSNNPEFGDFNVNSNESDWLLNLSVVEQKDIHEIYEKFFGTPEGFSEEFYGSAEFALSAKWNEYGVDDSGAEEAAVKNIKTIISNKLSRDFKIEDFLAWKSAKSGENELQKRCEALAAQGDILWRLDRGLFPGRLTPLNIMGTLDSSKSRLSEEIHANLRKDMQIVSNGNPHRLTLIQMAHGAPLYALKQMQEWEDLYKRKADRSTLHTITKNEYGIDLYETGIRPVALGGDSIFAYFTIADALEYIKLYHEEGKGKYFLTLDPEADYDPGRPARNELLGNNRIGAFERFSASAKLRIIVEIVSSKLKAYEEKGKIETAFEKIIENLERMIEQSKDDGVKNQLTKEASAVKRLMKSRQKKVD
jgi:hypothetical protein